MSQFHKGHTHFDGLIVNLTGDTSLHIKRYLGRGSIGGVFQASLKSRSSKQERLVAAKFVHLPNYSGLQTAAEDLQQSFLGFSALHRSLLDCKVFADEQLKGIWIISDYCYPGNTLLLSKELGGFSESLIACFVKEVLLVLVQLEERPSWQGLQCIKGSNILLDCSGQVRIVDYHQLSVILPLLDDQFNVKPSVVYWNGPETKFCDKFLNFSISSSGDIWALGIWIIELAQGFTPLQSHGPFKVASCLDAGERPQLECPSLYSIYFLDFLHQCLQMNPQLRPTARELLSHSFLSAASKEDTSHVLQHISSQDISSEVEDTYLTKEWIVILSGNKFLPLPYLSVFDVPMEQTKLVGQKVKGEQVDE
ncbi:Serine/threonine-protein kinase dst1 [Galdieria sulphuraria]|uniref:Serine/threonine-protein kinase n=1 Tax=Galdieria sulphuraria TaxID=130081 RepID=M2XHV7_GALSU|nr:serine/threonine-protein kinase [Galdieria sulphuraria]EME29677.1 serine/threonine-protein kinase [Galdieria sulphuraria]GJD12172.1 Serine/threonine-protein kinase dst1 [Galdieria sulphuraria]|eukprot:XP_005706197.1 serine/threonine-protein kinase [Galdieria sulphuraria]